MSINVSKYVDLEVNYALYGTNGYYLEPFLIKRIIIDETKIGMSFVELKKFIEECKITISADEIIQYMNQKRKEKYSQLELQNKTISKISPISLLEDVNVEEKTQDFVNELVAYKYRFEPYTLEYFKKNISILKIKCLNLLKLLDYLDKRKSMQISKDEWKVILDLDIHVNEEGNVYWEDINRLSEAMVYNIMDLYEKVKNGNDPSTYLDFKISKEKLYRDGVFESEIYPRKEIQLKDTIMGSSKEFIALTEKQKEKIRAEELENFSSWLDKCMIEDSNEVMHKQTEEQGPILEKIRK
jgi:hypothetical protein